MKKAVRQFLCMAIALCIIACCLPQRADAYSTRYNSSIHTLKQKTYVTSKGYVSSYSSGTEINTRTCHYYKITVPTGGYVTFHTNNSSKSIYIYKTVKKNKMYYNSDVVNSMYGKKTYYRVLPRGTYYLFAEKSLKFKWVFHKVATPSNYCRSKAYGLKANQKSTVVFPHGYEFPRWYKITVSSKKTLYFYLTDLTDTWNLSFSVFNASGIRIPCTSSYSNHTETYQTKSTVAKGTYYIRVTASDYSTLKDYYRGRMGTIMWR